MAPGEAGARRGVWRPALSALVALALVAGSGAALARGVVPCTLVPLQPTCQVIVAPGPTLDTIEAVRVVGAPSYASAGELRLTTIEVHEEEEWAAWWRERGLPDHESVVRTRFVPAGSDVDEVAAANLRAMEESRRVATVAALAALGLEGSHASPDPVGGAAAGGAPPDGRGLVIALDTGGIGGPSAGLMMALGIVDRLGPADLTGGLIIAGSGTIDEDGTVGAVGGIAQKIAGALASGPATRPASVFLVPRADLAAARRVTVDRAIVLVPVDTLADALAALDDLRAGRSPRGAVSLEASAPRG